jgi:hypothetical protein
MNACMVCGASPGFSSKTGAKSASDCYCVVGYGGSDCLRCPAGYYKNMTLDKGACIACKGGSTSPDGSGSPEQCGESVQYTHNLSERSHGIYDLSVNQLLLVSHEK